MKHFSPSEGGRPAAYDCPVCRAVVDASAVPSSRACPQCGSLLTTTASGVGPGTVLDDFRLLHRIGRGAMGEVFLAEQRSLSRRVAVKILSPGLTSTPAHIEQFRNEMQALAQLHHPNIVTAFYAGCCEGVHYFAMTYVGGETLRDRLRRGGYLSEEDALSVVYKVAEALRYAWDGFGLIHRDIKPANIMIDLDGDIKLTDLGVSKYVYEENFAPPRIRVIGTPLYMSPEQVRGEMDLDFRSDMYSLGATFYQMLAGHPPFEGLKIDEILRCQLQENPPPIRDRRPDLSGGCEAIVERMLGKLRSMRYDSWDEALDAVRKTLVRQAPVYLPRPSPAPAASAAPREKPAGAGRVWWLLLLLMLAALYGWRAWRGTLSAGDDAPPGFRPVQISERLEKTLGQLREQWERAAAVADGARRQLLAPIVEREKMRRVNDVMDYLDIRADALIEAGGIAEAAALYRNYEGPWDAESTASRLSRAEMLETSVVTDP